MEEQTTLVKQQRLNAEIENKVLSAQECKLKAEYDLTMANVTRTGEESALLVQRIQSEKAQTKGAVAEETSILGAQYRLYTNQAKGFERDAEQKFAKILTDTWNTRRTTDDATSANTENLLADSYIGAAVRKAAAGVGVNI